MRAVFGTEPAIWKASNKRGCNETQMHLPNAFEAPYLEWGGRTQTTAFASLAVTILLESAGTVCLKLASMHGLMWLVLAYGCYGSAFAIFPSVLHTLHMGQAYAIWSGAGCVLTAMNGFVFFAESLSVPQVVSIFFVLVGVTGLSI